MSQTLFDSKNKRLASETADLNAASKHADSDWISALLSTSGHSLFTDTKADPSSAKSGVNRNTIFSTPSANKTNASDSAQLVTTSNSLIDDRIKTLSKRVNKTKISIQNNDVDAIHKELQKTQAISQRLLAAIFDNTQLNLSQTDPYAVLQTSLQSLIAFNQTQTNSIFAGHQTFRNSQTSTRLSKLQLDTLQNKLNSVSDAIIEHHVASMSQSTR